MVYLFAFGLFFSIGFFLVRLRITILRDTSAGGWGVTAERFYVRIAGGFCLRHMGRRILLLGFKIPLFLVTAMAVVYGLVFIIEDMKSFWLCGK